MRVRNVILLVLLNIFLVMAFSVLSEYNEYRYSVQTLRSTVDNSVDSALISVTRSEEFFSDQFGSLDITSRGQSIYTESDGSRRNLYNSCSILRGNEWVSGNLYIMSMFYTNYGRFPSSQFEFDTFSTGKTVEDIYTYLFGTVGSDYASAELSWANDSPDIGIIDPTIRVPNPEFLSYYDNIGKDILETSYVKEKDGSSYKVVEKKYPVLTNMGLKLNEYNQTSSLITSDNFTSVVKEGHDEGNYFLTPYSLGVTYIPKDAFKTALLCNLENTIRFNGVRTDPINGVDRMTNYSDADGCIQSDVYDGGVDADGRHIASTTAVEHTSSSSYILNDGDVEYDLSTLSCKIDYFLVDYYNQNNYRIVNATEGALLDARGSADLAQLPNKLAETDGMITPTTTPEERKELGERVVAKVTVKLRVHIPYKSPILQWASHNNSVGGEEHFGVKRWDANSGSIVSGEDGLWYTYTTFYAISR